ncbi:MAG TPA: SEC-C metal-binding domain-containing protein [Ktedonobacteraceae bacterium]
MNQRDRAKGHIPIGSDIVRLDPDGGVLVYMSCWRPRLGDQDPELPGERVAMVIYRPTGAEELCPCGSGKRFGSCCSLLPYWRPVCLNPGKQGYSLVHGQFARFTNVPADAVYEFLQADERLYCTEDIPEHVFWTYWGKPAFDIPQGRLSFGDIELLERQTLLVSALSDARMEMLLEFLSPLELGTPHIQQEPFLHLEKPPRKVPARKRRLAPRRRPN